MGQWEASIFGERDIVTGLLESFIIFFLDSSLLLVQCQTDCFHVSRLNIQMRLRERETE